MKWIFSSGWHWIITYALGYVVFATLAIITWGFVYRPSVQVDQYGRAARGESWTAKELVGFALLQGVVWPLFVPVYLVWLTIKGTVHGALAVVELALNSGEKFATKVAKAIPDKRPRGFQIKR